MDRDGNQTNDDAVAALQSAGDPDHGGVTGRRARGVTGVSPRAE